MQSYEQKIIGKVQQSERLLEERYFNDWRKARTLEDREAIHTKTLVLKDLIRTVIHSIRGDING